MEMEKTKAQNHKRAVLVLLLVSSLILLSGCSSKLSLIFGKQKDVESISKDKYAYSCLSIEEKKLYDIMLDSFLNFKKDVVIKTVDPDVLEKIFYAVFADYGGLFWVSGYNYSSINDGESPNMLFSPDLTMTKKEKEEKEALVEKAKKEWLSGISKDSPDFYKSLYVYENLVSKVDYDENAPDSQNILSVFLNGKSVCQGYADAAGVLFDELGIKNVILRGFAQGEPHAWNLIMLDNEWYFFDATWGNSRFLDKSAEKKTVNYAYLNVTTEEMEKTHSIDMDITIPLCSATLDNYYKKTGLYFETMDKAALGQTFSNAYKNGQEQCSVKFRTQTAYLEALDYFVRKGNLGRYCEGLSFIYYNERRDVLVLTIYYF